MTCDLCRDLPLRTVNQISADVLSGDKSLTEISTTYSLDPVALDGHIASCIRSPKSGYALLDDMLAALNQAARERKDAHDRRPMDSEAMEHYISLQREARATILAMERVRPPEDMIRDIIQQVLRPLMNQWLSILVEEGNKLRLDITSFVDPSIYVKVDASIKQLLRRVATRFDQTRSGVIPNLQRIMNADGESSALDQSQNDDDSVEAVAEREMTK